MNVITDIMGVVVPGILPQFPTRWQNPANALVLNPIADNIASNTFSLVIHILVMIVVRVSPGTIPYTLVTPLGHAIGIVPLYTTQSVAIVSSQDTQGIVGTIVLPSALLRQYPLE